MPSAESIKKIGALKKAGQEEILNYLEEIIVLGSYATEVTNQVKENRFAKGKGCVLCATDRTGDIITEPI